jgi:hypothetical protein
MFNLKHGHPLAGFFFGNDRLTAPCERPAIFNGSGFLPGTDFVLSLDFITFTMVF